jgi:hypothetical protein
MSLNYIKSILVRITPIYFIIIVFFFLILANLFFRVNEFGGYDGDVDTFIYSGQRLLAGAFHWTENFDDKLPIIQILFLLPGLFKSVLVWFLLSFIIILFGAWACFYLVNNILSHDTSIPIKERRLVASLSSISLVYLFLFLPGNIFHINAASASFAIISLALIVKSLTLKGQLKILPFFISTICASVSIGIRPYFLISLIIGASLLIINRSEFLNGRNGGFLRVFLWIVITGLVGFLTNVAPYIVIDNLDAFFAGVYMMTQDLIPQRMPITITRMVTVIYEQNLLVLMLTILSLCSIVYSLSIFSIKKISINRSLNDVITIVFICPLLLMLLIFTKHFHRHYLQLFVPFLAIGVGLFFPLLKNKFINFLSNIKTKTIWATTIFFVVIFCLEIFFKDFVNVYFTIWKKIDPIYPKIEKIISMQPKNKSDFLFLNDTRVHWTLQEPRHGFPAQGNTVHIIVWGAWDKFNMPEYFNHPTNAEEYCAELEKRGPTILIIRKMPNFKKLCLRKSSVYNFEEKLSDNVSLFKRN